MRVVSPDRPAAGRSDPAPQAGPEAWARDVAGLADALGLERFGLLTWSGGGRYAATVASALAERVTALAIVAAVPPGGARARSRSLRGAAVTWELRRIARRDPERFVRLIARVLPECDRDWLERPAIWENEVANVAEAFRQRVGAALREALCQADPWRRPPLPASLPVTLWVGAADRNVPAAQAPAWGAAAPHAKVRVLEQEGHLIFYSRAREILGWLAERA